jgi:hypothetical protein
MGHLRVGPHDARLTRGNRKLRYRGLAKNDHWLHHRAAALNLRRMITILLDHTGANWAIAQRTSVQELASTTNRLQRLPTAGRPPCRPPGLTSTRANERLEAPRPKTQ